MDLQLSRNRRAAFGPAVVARPPGTLTVIPPPIAVPGMLGLQQGGDTNVLEHYFPNPWVEMPAGGTSFFEIGNLDLPLPNGFETVVLQFQVPFGLDGIVQGIITSLNSGGLVPASGDVIWRMRTGSAGLNGQPVRSFSSLTVEVGTFAGGYFPMPGGVMVSEQEYVVITVTNIVGSGVPNGVGNQTVVSLSGYYWPTRYTTAAEFRAPAFCG